MDTAIPFSEHFQIELLAEGVFAAIAQADGAAFSNAGIIDLGDHTVIFDTFLTLAAAHDLQNAAIVLTGKTPDLVINSHWHLDHVSGNQVFRDATVLGTAITRDAITTTVAERQRQRGEQMPAELRSIEERLAHETNPDERHRLSHLRRTGTLLLQTASVFKPSPPNQIFTDHLILAGKNRQANLVTLGSGHTVSDTFLHLPEEGILFAGDLLSVQGHHWMGDGDPDAWRRTLEYMERLQTDIIVPGHGPVGTIDDMRLMRHYISSLSAIATSVVARGGTADEAAREQIPDLFSSWSNTSVFARNMRFLHARSASTRTD